MWVCGPGGQTDGEMDVWMDAWMAMNTVCTGMELLMWNTSEMLMSFHTLTENRDEPNMKFALVTRKASPSTAAHKIQDVKLCNVVM